MGATCRRRSGISRRSGAAGPSLLAESLLPDDRFRPLVDRALSEGRLSLDPATLTDRAAHRDVRLPRGPSPLASSARALDDTSIDDRPGAVRVPTNAGDTRIGVRLLLALARCAPGRAASSRCGHARGRQAAVGVDQSRRARSHPPCRGAGSAGTWWRHAGGAELRRLAAHGRRRFKSRK